MARFCRFSPPRRSLSDTSRSIGGLITERTEHRPALRRETDREKTRGAVIDLSSLSKVPLPMPPSFSAPFLPSGRRW